VFRTWHRLERIEGTRLIAIGGEAPSGALTIPSGTTTITATFKKADGTAESRVTGTEFDVRIAPASVDLFHRAEAHADFGPYNFQLRIQ
jgi:hypothetical protein